MGTKNFKIIGKREFIRMLNDHIDKKCKKRATNMANDMGVSRQFIGLVLSGLRNPTRGIIEEVLGEGAEIQHRRVTTFKVPI